jgi:hypothetical protein
VDFGFGRPSRGPCGHEWGVLGGFYGVGRGSEVHTSVYDVRCLEVVKMDVRVRVCSAQEVYLSAAMISPMKFGALKSLPSVVNG